MSKSIKFTGDIRRNISKADDFQGKFSDDFQGKFSDDLQGKFSCDLRGNSEVL